MMHLGCRTARQAMNQAVRRTQSIQQNNILKVAAFSSSASHRHRKTPTFYQEQQQSPSPATSSPATSPYQSFRPDPDRKPVFSILPKLTIENR
jgi:hypothetical protein